MLVLLAVLPAAAEAAPWPEAGGQLIDRPGEILFVESERRAALARLPERRRALLCGAPRSFEEHAPQAAVGEEEQPGEDLVRTLMEAAAVHLAFPRNEAARRAIMDNLTAWAGASALSHFKGETSVTHYYNLDRSLLPMIVAFWLVADDPELRPADVALVHGWLERLVIRRGPRRRTEPTKVISRNNHRYLKDSVTMAWGAFTGRAELFEVGLRRYARALAQMRPDGSLPLETARGHEALFYQRHALASLVTIAEMAAVQGIDLYELRNARGDTIHSMVRFLVQGIEDPTSIEAHAPARQDMSFMVWRGHGRHYMAWTAAYRARFHGSDLAERLAAALDRFMPDDDLPLVDDYAGGAATCFYGRVAPLLPEQRP